jgi:hypothetical protein
MWTPARAPLGTLARAMSPCLKASNSSGAHPVAAKEPVLAQLRPGVIPSSACLDFERRNLPTDEYPLPTLAASSGWVSNTWTPLLFLWPCGASVSPITWSERQRADADPGTLCACPRGDRGRVGPWAAVRAGVVSLSWSSSKERSCRLRRRSDRSQKTIFAAWNHARQHSARQCRVDATGADVVLIEVTSAAESKNVSAGLVTSSRSRRDISGGW